MEKKIANIGLTNIHWSFTDLNIQSKSNTGIASGFIGCIKDVQLSRQLISIQSELEPRITQRKNIVECSDNPCSRMPCANGGSCEAYNQGYKCNCKQTFTG